MRFIVSTLVVAAVLSAAGSQPSEAQRRGRGPTPWCIANGNLGAGTMDCAYWTLQQCLDSASGAGGVCRENPEILWARRYQQQSRGQQQGSWR